MIGQFAIGSRNLRPSVDDKDDMRSVVKCETRLAENLAGNELLFIWQNSAGIDQFELAVMVAGLRSA